jgi:hypothetical protein
MPETSSTQPGQKPPFAPDRSHTAMQTAFTVTNAAARRRIASDRHGDGAAGAGAGRSVASRSSSPRVCAP